MKVKCSKCQHEWETKLEHPLACPKCKRYDWKLKEIVSIEIKEKEINIPELKEENGPVCS